MKKYGPWKRKFAFLRTDMTSRETVWLKLYYERRVTNYIDGVTVATMQGREHDVYETVQRVATTLDMLRL